MPEYPDNFQLKPGDKATVVIQYNDPKTGITSKGRTKGAQWILYQVIVNNDGVKRGWFTSPGDAAHEAHEMIQKRGYGPAHPVEVELTVHGHYVLSGETYEEVMGGQTTAAQTPQPDPPSMDGLEKRIGVAIKLIHSRLEDIEAAVLAKATDEPEENLPF